MKILMLLITSSAFTFATSNAFASKGYGKPSSKQERTKMKKRMHKGHAHMTEEQREKIREIKDSDMSREDKMKAIKELKDESN